MNKFGIIGLYTIIIPTESGEKRITHTNLITEFGESFFLNRWINDAFEPIEYILIGNGNNLPQKTDLSLGNQTNKKKCICEADLKSKRLILTANFKAEEMLGTTEIGVANNKILISHDRYEKLTSDHLTGAIGDIKIEYIFQLSTGAIKRGWTKSTEGNNIFYAPEKNEVVGVFENNTGSGYRRLYSLQDLRSVKGGFFYDTVSQNIYIKPTKDADSIVDIDNEEIVVQVK
ncbi:hypothetical protein [Methanobrevibacter sp.]|uniref:hypothetical protein n=1 Tax=Methanobrevibacter sp. TaxID=66852 RepID=UPI00386D86D6